MERLNDDMFELLKQCLKSHNPKLLKVVVDKNFEIQEDLGEELREIINNELLDKGLNKNDEPNIYGKKLELLIDIIGRYYM
ncbi:hypothetical protein [Fictibacillus nanhaiensis]|uniref:hypothetical protein n=1 Tax=Fictibacillus nanhaiensis TaxID=742169 RepID=UPI003C2630BF